MKMKSKMGLLTLLLLVAALCAAPSLAEEEKAVGIAGSDAHAVLDALEAFGIPTPEPQKKANGSVWESTEVEIDGVRSSYTVSANAEGELVKATFYMEGKKNDLFACAAAIAYDAANPQRAAQFVKSNTGKEKTTIIGDAEFALSVRTTVSTSSISIGGWSRSSTSETKTYVLRIAQNDLLSSGEGAIAKVTKGVNIRAEDNADSERLGHAQEGEELVVLKAFYSPKWHQIYHDGQVAYVSASYCEIVSEQ